MHNLKNIVYALGFFISIFIFNSLVHAYASYSIGDEVEYNGIKFYVIKDSGSTDDNVILLKGEPLTVGEINKYGGVGTDNNHVNMYITSNTTASYYQTAYDLNGYGGMAYYSSSTCGNGTYTGCTTDYGESEVKYVVDAWKKAKVPAASEARLITREEYGALTLAETYETATEPVTKYVPQYEWMYNDSYWYWTSSQYNDSSSDVWIINHIGFLDIYLGVSYYGINVRPVIILNKINLTDNGENNIDNISLNNSVAEERTNSKNEVLYIVKAPNTMQKISIVLIMIGVMLVSVSIVIVIKVKK